ncbi:U4/U6 small nuclear ribonucleoprotein prp4 [Coemansia sp. RSA 1290]|nr:U4/U6 small nuclear ribonucleoprotein prp4 [Coemansia sp. RSA 1290]KAJ2651316.1 U4/U6 small nuclear ribonucleoprotein prp4 [Coemansia sp. RSA 1250]
MRNDSHSGVEEGEVIERQLPPQQTAGTDVPSPQLDSEIHTNGSRLQRKRRLDHRAESHSHKKHSSNLEHVDAKPSMVNSGHVQIAGCEDTADLDIALPFEHNEELEAQRLLEERRRRRQLIMQKHATQSNSLDSSADVRPSANNTSSDPVAHAKLSQENDQFALGKPYSASAANDSGVVAADYNPNDDSQADDIRHRAAAKAVKAATKTVPSTNDEDEFDMFADDDEIPTIGPGSAAGAAPGAAISAVASMMADSWDDAEGYYRTIIDELLDGRYQVQAFLGQGVFSSVLRAADTQNGNAPVAIKIIRQNDLMHKAGIKEKRMLDRLQAADPDGKMHVVRLIGSFVHRGHLCLCFELMSLNLREVVRKYGRDTGLSLQAVRIYGMHLMLALDLLRQCRVIHGDIKPDNCFVSEQRNHVKLGDLGSACDVSENEVTPYLVSRFYRAPEIMLGLAYDCAIDMWSVGTTLFELYTGKIMFPGRNNNHMLHLIMETRGPFSSRMLRRGQFWHQHFEDNGSGAMDFIVRSTDKLSGAEAERRIVFTKPTTDIKTRVLQATPPGSSPQEIQQAVRFADLLARCLELNPEKRILPIDALRHPFFNQPK